MAVSGNTASTGIAYDLISEGQIELVDGLSSVYLNRTPIVNKSNKTKVESVAYSARNITLNSATQFVVDIQYPEVGTNVPILVYKGGGQATIASVTSTATQSTVTTSGNFFTDAMINGASGARGAFIPKIRITGGAIGGGDYVGGVVSRISDTQAIIFPAIPGNTNGVITFDHYSPTSSYVSYTLPGATALTVFTVSSIPNYSNLTGTIRALIDSSSDNLSGSSDDRNFDFAQVEFRGGTIDQPPITTMPGFTNASLGVAKSVEIKQYTPYFAAANLFRFTQSGWGKYNMERPTGASGGPEVVTNASEIAPGAINEVDELLVTIAAPGGLYAANAEGNPRVHKAVFQIIFKYSNGEVSKEELIYGPTDAQIAAANILISLDSGTFYKGGPEVTGTIASKSKSAVDFDFRWSVEEYKPFTDFQIIIRKVTTDNMEYNNDQFIAGTSLKAVQAFINDKISYPLSGYAAVGFDSKEFAGEFPERAYHCYGVRTQIPSNYVTREQAEDGIAKYTRNTTTGAIETTYQLWNGELITGYCNNPVWNLREILVNKRWGLGHWMSSDNINDYSLYSLARYCDELVPDGNGGYEPRFTCGVYLTQATEAYKVIKDFSTIMLALPYWVDGQLILEGDRPAEPVYAFTKGNIEGGLFSYEGTGNKTRPNQIVVRYNNKDNFYEQDVELVDDIEDMVKNTRIFSEEVTAFGATSKSQAIRYGKWKLLTSKMQKEVVSFKTGEGAAYIKPGSIVTIQDADKNAIRYSGRIISATTSQVTVDSNVTLYSGEDYTLHVFIVGPAVYLVQNTAVINGTSYSAGDQLPATIDAVLIDSEEKASAIIDDSGDPVDVQFAADAHIESRPISNSPSSTSVLNITGSFTSAPESEVVWAITVKKSGALVAGSSKAYKILSIGEESPGLYNITAAEHYNAKFDLVDEEFITSPAQPEVPRYTEVPPVTMFTGIVTSSISTSDENGGVAAPAISLSWVGPKTWVGNIPTLYQNFDIYEISWVTPSGVSERVTVPKSANAYTISNVLEGRYDFTIRAKSNVGPISNPARTTVTVFFTSRKASDLAFVLPKGGIFDRPIKLSGGSIETSSNYKFTADSGRNVYVSQYKPLAIEKYNFWYDTGSSTLKQWMAPGWLYEGATISLSASAYSVNESGSITVTLSTIGVADAEEFDYTITGVSSGDIDGASLTGTFTISGGTASATFDLTEDETAEGPEIFTLTLDNGVDYVSVSIDDSSVPGVIPGAASITLGNFGISGAGTFTPEAIDDITGAASITLGDFGLSSAGTVSTPPSGITGAASITLGDFGLSSAGTVSTPPSVITGAASITLGDFGLSSAGTVGGAASSPTLEWSGSTNGVALYDIAAESIAVGDVIIAHAIGFYTNSGTGGQRSVNEDGWSLIGTNGSSATAWNMSYMIVTAGNIGTLTYRNGNSATLNTIFAIRGADLAQFSSTVNGNGDLEIDDSTVVIINSASGLNTASGTVDSANSLVISTGAARANNSGLGAPAGYTFDAEYSNVDRSLSSAIAYKSNVSAGTEDPGIFSGSTGTNYVGYTIIVAPV